MGFRWGPGRGSDSGSGVGELRIEGFLKRSLKVLYNNNKQGTCGSLNPHLGERTGLVVRASDSGSGDPGSILGRVGVLFP